MTSIHKDKKIFHTELIPKKIEKYVFPEGYTPDYNLEIIDDTLQVSFDQTR